MKKLLYLFGLFLLISCINSKKAKNTEIASLDKEEIKVKEKLDSCLVKGVLELTEEVKDYLNYPDVPLDESFVLIIFEVNPEDSLIDFSDITVEFFIILLISMIL